jgi:hypothetical protein
LGRFISADWSATPIPVPYADFRDPQSLNLYTYVRNIPTSAADADGHCWPLCALVPVVAGRVADDVQVSGGGKAFAKDVGIGAAKGTGSFALHGALVLAGPLGIVADHFIGEPKALQGSTQTQTDAKVTTIVVETVATILVPGPKGAAAEGEGAGAAGGATGSKPTALPVEGEPGTTATKLHPDGSPKQVRQYGPDGKAQTDTDFHQSPAGNPHAHDWDHSGNQPQRSDPRPIKPTDPQP